jgi:hypothetical protein
MKIIELVKIVFGKSEQQMIAEAESGLRKFYEREKSNITMTKGVAISDHNHYFKLLRMIKAMPSSPNREKELKSIVKQVKMMNKFNYADGMY